MGGCFWKYAGRQGMWEVQVAFEVLRPTLPLVVEEIFFLPYHNKYDCFLLAFSYHTIIGMIAF